MSESVLAASGFSLVSLWFQAEKGTLSPLECLSFANTIQADLPTCELHTYLKICLKFMKFLLKPKKTEYLSNHLTFAHHRSVNQLV